MSRVDTDSQSGIIKINNIHDKEYLRSRVIKKNPDNMLIGNRIGLCVGCSLTLNQIHSLVDQSLCSTNTEKNNTRVNKKISVTNKIIRKDYNTNLSDYFSKKRVEFHY